MSSLNDEIRGLHMQLLSLMEHPEATGQDKASIVMAGTSLAEIEKRHKPRTVRGSMPASVGMVPRAGGFEPVPGLDPGWMLRRERAEESSHA